MRQVKPSLADLASNLRVKIQFHWQRGADNHMSHSRLSYPSPDGHAGAPGDDGAGTWVRVATPLAAEPINPAQIMRQLGWKPYESKNIASSPSPDIVPIIYYEKGGFAPVVALLWLLQMKWNRHF